MSRCLSRRSALPQPLPQLLRLLPLRLQSVPSGPCGSAFTCAATPCKGKGGVKRYQDKTDSKGTGNLISHARRCFGADFVDEVCSGQGSGGGTQSGDIRAAFARMTGAPQQPEVSTRPLTSKQTR